MRSIRGSRIASCRPSRLPARQRVTHRRMTREVRSEPTHAEDRPAHHLRHTPGAGRPPATSRAGRRRRRSRSGSRADAANRSSASAPSAAPAPQRGSRPCRARTSSCSRRRRPDAGAASRERARPAAGAERGEARPAARTGAGAADEVEVPASLRWPGLDSAARGATRGWLGQVLLSRRRRPHRSGEGSGGGSVAAGGREARRRTGRRRRVPARRRHAAAAEGQRTPAREGARRGRRRAAAGAAARHLLEHHRHLRQAVDASTRDACAQLFDAHYGDRVYALDHPTLGASPIANALTLARGVAGAARGCTCVSHSRGGLVAEVLARVCAARRLEPRRSRAVRRRRLRAAPRRDLQELGDDGAGSRRIQRRARGARRLPGARHAARLEAARRLPVGLQVGARAGRRAGAARAGRLPREVAQRRADPTELPGLEAHDARQPAGAMAQRAATTPIAGRAARRRRRHRGRLGRLVGQDAARRRVLLDRQRPGRADALDVRRRAARRRRRRRFLLDQGGKVSHFNYFTNERTARRSPTRCSTTAPAEFRAIGPLSWAGEDRERHARGAASRARAAATRGTPAATSRRCSCCRASSAAT